MSPTPEPRMEICVALQLSIVLRPKVEAACDSALCLPDKNRYSIPVAQSASQPAAPKSCEGSARACRPCG
jgi:hypothetical protein